MTRKTGLQRGKPLARMSKERLAEFAELGIYPASTFKPKPPKTAKTKRAKDTGPDAHTVELVLQRDHYQCVVCGDPLHGRRGAAWSIHHRLRRSQGLDNRPSNLIAVCGGAAMAGCHQEIHSQITKAQQGGWLVPSTEDPAETPVILFLHGRSLLDNEGGYERVKEACA